MSNEIALVKFPNGEVLFTGYHGCGSRINPYLKTDKTAVFKDAFQDSEYDAVMERATDYDEVEAFYRERDGRTYPNAVVVEVFTPYGGGILWKGKACLESHTVVEGVTDDKSEDIEYESNEEWPSWVKALGTPNTNTLVASEWPVHLPLTVTTSSKGPSY